MSGVTLTSYSEHFKDHLDVVRLLTKVKLCLVVKEPVKDHMWGTKMAEMADFQEDWCSGIMHSMIVFIQDDGYPKMATNHLFEYI